MVYSLHDLGFPTLNSPTILCCIITLLLKVPKSLIFGSRINIQFPQVIFGKLHQAR